jgi:hypothetical protein
LNEPEIILGQTGDNFFDQEGIGDHKKDKIESPETDFNPEIKWFK